MEGAQYLEDGGFPVLRHSFEANKRNVTDFHAFRDEAKQLPACRERKPVSAMPFSMATGRSDRQ